VGGQIQQAVSGYYGESLARSWRNTQVLTHGDKLAVEGLALSLRILSTDRKLEEVQLVGSLCHGIEEHPYTTDYRCENLVYAFVDCGIERVAWPYKNRVKVLIEIEVLLVKRDLPI
jgi:hypothetical protein